MKSLDATIGTGYKNDTYMVRSLFANTFSSVDRNYFADVVVQFSNRGRQVLDRI